MTSVSDKLALPVGSPDEEVRREAVVALRSRGDAFALRLLDQALGDESWRVRKAAVEVIREFPDRPSAVGSLIESLGDADNAGRRNAALEALIAMGRSAVSTIVSRLDHQDPEVRKFLVDILGQIRDPSSAEAVLKITRDPADNLKLSAVEALGSIGGERAFNGLLSLLPTDDASLQFGALHALGRIGRPIPMELIRPLLGKKLFRRAVYDVLGWSKSPEAAELLAEGLLETAPSSKQAAVRALARLAEEPALEELVERTLKARLAMQPLEPLLALLENNNPTTKRAVVKILALLGTAEAVSALNRVSSDDTIQSEVNEALARLKKGNASAAAPREKPPLPPRPTATRVVEPIGLESRVFGPMDNESFVKVRDLVAGDSGLYYESDLKYLVERRMQRLMEITGARDYGEYLSLLQSGGDSGRIERRRLINALSTNETYFFREDFQLRAFAEEILPALAAEKDAGGSRRLRIWSAGCSSGEEPATIAMLIKETGGFESWLVEVVGSDINEDTIDLARTGLYHPSSFRVTPAFYVNKYFSPDGSRLRLNEEIRNMIVFDATNILEGDLAPHLRNLDVIFCRNVIIYFSPAAKKKAVENFYKLLRPGGYLLLGHSESLMSISTRFELVHLQHDLVYRKPRGRR